MGHAFSLDHFKVWASSLDRRMASAIVIIEDENRTILVKANYKHHWTFPGGVVDAGETPKEAAIREVEEEVNLILDPDKLEFGWVVSRNSKVAMTYQFVFKYPLGELKLDDIILQQSEIDEWKLVTKEEILSENLHYSKASALWARGPEGGYVEQSFGDGA